MKLKTLERAFHGRERVLGPLLGLDSENTLRSGNSLGICLASLQEYHAAAAVLLKTAEIREKVLGLEHKDTLFTCATLGACFFKQGDLEKAAVEFEQALKGREKVLGRDTILQQR